MKDDDLSETVVKGNFINKLRGILENDKYSQIIRWSDKGDSVIITDMIALEIEVLPNVFKTNVASSFIRQLNNHGFKKRTPSGENFKFNEFYHPMFHRDRPDIVCLKKPKKPPELSLDTATGLQLQINQINQRLIEMSSMQSNLLEQHRNFYEEVASIREKQDAQSESITKILKFLYNFLGPNRKDDKLSQQNIFVENSSLVGDSNSSVNNKIMVPTQYFIYDNQNQLPQQQIPLYTTQPVQIQPGFIQNTNMNAMNQNFDTNFSLNNPNQTYEILNQPIIYNGSIMAYHNQNIQPQTAQNNCQFVLNDNPMQNFLFQNQNQPPIQNIPSGNNTLSQNPLKSNKNSSNPDLLDESIFMSNFTSR